MMSSGRRQRDTRESRERRAAVLLNGSSGHRASLEDQPLFRELVEHT
jgi:hypothetical protein